MKLITNFVLLQRLRIITWQKSTHDRSQTSGGTHFMRQTACHNPSKYTKHKKKKHQTYKFIIQHYRRNWKELLERMSSDRSISHQNKS